MVLRTVSKRLFDPANLGQRCGKFYQSQGAALRLLEQAIGSPEITITGLPGSDEKPYWSTATTNYKEIHLGVPLDGEAFNFTPPRAPTGG